MRYAVFRMWQALLLVFTSDRTRTSTSIRSLRHPTIAETDPQLADVGAVYFLGRLLSHWLMQTLICSRFECVDMHMGPTPSKFYTQGILEKPHMPLSVVSRSLNSQKWLIADASRLHHSACRRAGIPHACIMEMKGLECRGSNALSHCKHQHARSFCLS